MCAACPSLADRPDIGDINAALDRGASLRSIALTFGVPKTTLIRYRDSRLAQGPIAPSVRVRVRPAPIKTPQEASPDEAMPPPATEECEQLPPTEAKLREVAKLLAQGFSREEIAVRFRVSAGTVTDWHRKIRENGVALVQTVTAENIVATLLSNSQQRTAMLARIAHRAEITAPRVAIAAAEGLRKEDQHIAALADSLGVLSRFPAQVRDELDDPNSVPNLFREMVRQAAETSPSETDDKSFVLDFMSVGQGGGGADPAEPSR